MKNFRHFLWFIALVGLITSCSQDEAAGPQNEASNRVRIGASIHQALQTRAGSVTIPEHYQLRYVLEVWSTGNVPTLICKYEKIATDATAVEFTFNLTEAKDYKALLWADFVTDGTGSKVDAAGSLNEYIHYADHYYVTNSFYGLKGVALAKTGTNYVINDDARDAFFSCLPIKKETGAFADNVELKRPFGQINVIEKNTDLRDNVTSMTLTYKVPQTFDVETGATTGTADVNPTVNTLPTADGDRKANLFYDYIFTPAEGQTTLGEIKLTFTDNDQATNLNDFTIPANMPVKRNKRTNISGNILHTSTVPSTSAKLSVTVSDGWTGEAENEEIPELVWDGTTTSQPAGYDATTPGEVEITSAPELAWLAQQKNTFENYTFKLTADIDLNHHEWKPIGSSYQFKGTFDGQNHTVSNMKCTTSQSAGLFGCVKAGEVSNLRVNGNVTTTLNYAGGIVGTNENSTVKNCIFSGNVNGGYAAGGIAGWSFDNSHIAGCQTKGEVTTTGGATGGIAGMNRASTIDDCCSAAKVTANDNHVGGIAGTNENSGSITRCYATGMVRGTNYVGGIVGNNSSSTVTNCLALNPGLERTAGNYLKFGQIVGHLFSSPTIENCAAFKDMTITDAASSQSIANRTGIDGTDLTADECLTEATYTTREFTDANGWAFDTGATWTYLPWNKVFEGWGISADTYRISVPDHINGAVN